MRIHEKLAAAVLLAGAGGCVPLSEYQQLEERFEKQERYVEDHEGEVRELERREQVMTLRSREQERQLDLMRTRLEKSERIRDRLQGELDEATAVPASAPREEQPPSVMGLEVNPATQGLVLESGLLFPPGEAELKEGGRQMLDKLVEKLNSDEHAGSSVRVDGHTDSAPIRHSDHDSNWELSAKRALAVLHHLEEEGIASERLEFAGYGPYEPIAEGSDDEAKAKNRRVEIVLVER